TPWKISINGEQYVHENIRRVSMDKFYEIVTGHTTAFKELCEVLPTVLDDVIETFEKGTVENTVFNELGAISPNLLKSLYLLSFSKYEGFDTLNI
ncbi:MAG TPA: Eco47II family restriction endonuclease, partial [Epsilonproteobacteria bacterium]|nr:Eco47II family restriction endonuclease [Campylobacterota bacterium]